MKSMTVRRDAWEAGLSAEERLKILEDHSKYSLDEQIKRLKSLFGKELSRSAYYRIVARLRQNKNNLIAEVEAGKISTESAVASVNKPALTEIREQLRSISKQLDMISRKQSFMDLQMQSISTGQKDAFVMYMNMRNLNRVIRNSAFVSDVLEFTKDIPYPGKRHVPIKQIVACLERLEKCVEKRIDEFLQGGFAASFDKRDLTDTELFMLRMRFLWGCTLINQLERDTKIPLSREEELAEDIFRCEIDPVCLFVKFWKEMRKGWLQFAADMVYRFGKMPTPYECSVGQAREIMRLCGQSRMFS